MKAIVMKFWRWLKNFTSCPFGEVELMDWDKFQEENRKHKTV